MLPVAEKQGNGREDEVTSDDLPLLSSPSFDIEAEPASKAGRVDLKCWTQEASRCAASKKNLVKTAHINKSFSSAALGLEEGLTLLYSKEISVTSFLWLSRMRVARLGRLAVPLIVQQMVTFSIGLVGVGFVGHLGEFELGVLVLSNSIFTATGLASIMGVASTMETLCGQAYGAKQFASVGIIYQRALLICAPTITLVIILWCQLEGILLATGQDPAIAAATASYTQATIPSLVLLVFSETGKRYLMAQNNVTPMAVVFAIGSLLAPLFNWLFIYFLGMGLVGAAIAFSAVNGTNSLLLTAYIVWHNHKLRKTAEAPWLGWSAVAFRNWLPYIYIAVPSLLLLCLEWWLWEAMIVCSGLLKHPEMSLAATGILMNMMTIVYTFPFGLGSATSTRVSIALGAGDHRGAVMTAKVSLVMVLVGQSVLGTAMLLGRSFWGFLFTGEAPVVALAARVFPIVALACLGDGVNAIMSGAVRGCGRQAKAAIVNAVNFWCIGLPLTTLLAFKLDLGISGLWGGLTIAASLQAITITAIVLTLDWRHEAQRAAANVQKEAEASKDKASVHHIF